MSVSEEHLITKKTARYYTQGNINTASNVWFVLHGYGQLAPYFIKKFAGLDSEDHFVVAPEGLHRFYLKNSSGRVGASWMTKEARLEDIHDYIAFLNLLYAKYSDQIASKNIIVLGFSQGAATASRWVGAGEVAANHLVLWAGVFPPDMDAAQTKAVVNTTHITYCLGNDDPYFPEEKQRELKEYLKDLNLNYDLFRYSGKHTIPGEALDRLKSKITSEN